MSVKGISIDEIRAEQQVWRNRTGKPGEERDCQLQGYL